MNPSSGDTSENTGNVKRKKTSSFTVAKMFKDIVRPSVSRATKQPVGLKMMAGLSPTGSKYLAVQNKYISQTAHLNLHLRELNKLEAAKAKIIYEEVEEPGVIPRTLSKVENTIERFNVEEQPRIEQIMDSINGNLTESQGILNKVNVSSGKVLSFLSDHSLLVQAALAIAGGGIVLTLILIPILLLKILIFGL